MCAGWNTFKHNAFVRCDCQPKRVVTFTISLLSYYEGRMLMGTDIVPSRSLPLLIYKTFFFFRFFPLSVSLAFFSPVKPQRILTNIISLESIFIPRATFYSLILTNEQLMLFTIDCKKPLG